MACKKFGEIPGSSGLWSMQMRTPLTWLLFHAAIVSLVGRAGLLFSQDIDLLRDGVALHAKVEQIVTPFLRRHNQDDTPASSGNETTKRENNGASSERQAWAIVVGIVSKDGKHVSGFGRMSAEAKQRPDGRTLFEIGSVTKTFTALALAEMVERNQLKLDDRVQQYLPESVAVPKRGDKEITLHHLATHTSALPRVPLAILVQGTTNPYRDFGTEELYATLKITSLFRDPGERYGYSNLGYGLLGHMLSLQTECGYEELIVERICMPLGLRDTRIQLTEEQHKRLAPGHTYSGEPTSHWDFDAFAGAGALRSTADDMLGYLEANMGLKKTALLAAMRRCHEVRHPAGNKIQSIGLGWHQQTMSRGARLVFHGGGTGGYSSIVGFVEQDNQPTFGLVVLANAGPGSADGMVANDVAIKLLELLHSEKD